MKYYVIINGESSLDIQGLAIESLPSISKPLMRSKREEIDGRNGDIITQLGYGAYDKTLKIGLWGNYDIDEIISYFNQDGIITFSNEPDMYYNFTILNRIDFINQLEAFRKATITIHCQPFKYKEEETEELEIEEHQEDGTSLNLKGTIEAPMQSTLKGNTNQKTAILPSEYTQVNYIIPTGNAYISTGIKAKGSLKIITDIEVVDTPSGNMTLFGARDNASVNANVLLYAHSTPRFRNDYNTTTNYASPNISNLLTKWHIVKDKGSLTATSSDNQTITETTTNATFTSSYDMDIFNANSGDSRMNQAKYRLYNFTIYDDTTLVRDFIPCYRNSDSAVGLYDIVNGVFYEKSGSGSLSYGSVVSIPNPSYPQDIHNVSGNNNIVVCGKNVININGIYSTSSTSNLQRSYENGIATLTWTSGFSLYMEQDNSESNFIPLPDSTKTYTISFKHKGDALHLRFDESNTNILSTNVDSDYTTYSYTFSGLSEIKIKFIRKDTTGTAYLKDFQLEEGSTATTYELYNGTTYPINLPSGMELSKIGTYQDYIYKENDKWYLHKEIGKVVLNGTEHWSKDMSGSSFSNNVFGAKHNISDMYSFNKFAYGDFGISCLKSNLFVQNKVYQSNNNGIDCGWGTDLYIKVQTSVIGNPPTIDDGVSYLKTWLGTNNLILYYPLATPTNTEITDTTLISQLEAIYNAKSKNGTTNINQVNNDLPFILDVSYLSGTDNITITNHGNYYSKPKLTLTGTGNIGIYLNDSQIFQVALGTNETIIIDTDKMEAYYESTLKNRQVIGDYNSFKLLSGENTIKISGTFSKLQVDNYSRWI